EQRLADMRADLRHRMTWNLLELMLQRFDDALHLRERGPGFGVEVHEQVLLLERREQLLAEVRQYEGARHNGRDDDADCGVRSAERRVQQSAVYAFAEAD